METLIYNIMPGKINANQLVKCFRKKNASKKLACMENAITDLAKMAYASSEITRQMRVRQAVIEKSSIFDNP
jgi:hypothetical protein